MKYSVFVMPQKITICKYILLLNISGSAVPFVVSFVTDSWEVAGNDAEGTTANDATDNQGFKIYYEQS